jgi:phosphatidylglycerophosphate synthase
MATPSMAEIRSAAQRPSNIWWRIFYLASGYIVWISAKLGLSPNHLTLSAAAINVIGLLVVLSCPTNTTTLIAAYCVFFTAHAFDFADGQFANVTNRRSRQGAWLDSSLDIFKIAIITASFYKIIHAVDGAESAINIADIAIVGNLVNYSVSLAANSYRQKVDAYESSQTPLNYSLSIYGIKGRIGRFIISNIREYGNFLFILLLFALIPRWALALLICWGAVQWALAANRIRHIAGLLASD